MSKIPPHRPHGRLEVRVVRHFTEGVSNAEVEIQGCNECLVEAIAMHLAVSPPFKELINKAIRLANERKAQKEN
jgi:hypothetical protein